MSISAHRPVVLALVPARGGSKGIPRKNIRLLAGKPVLHYAVEAGLRAALVDRVVCSTDDAEIAAVARRAGAEVPFLRPAELAHDSTEDWPVFVHALRWLEEHEGWTPDLVVNLRRVQVPADLVGAIIFFASDDSDFITGQTLVVDGGATMH